ncbi:MAG: carboxypeptidase-like regulatory domain-containing protein [Frankiaceae bacterium]
MTRLAPCLAALAAAVLLAGCGSAAGTAGSSSSAGPGSAHVVGTVTAGPTCPVVQAGSACPDRPVPGARVQALRAGSVVATTRTDATGAFRLDLEPGAYAIVATNVGGYRSTAERQVSILAGQRATVDLVLDTGIR